MAEMNREAIEATIAKAQVCRLAMLDGDRPYIVPLLFGYEDDALYFHGAPGGRKLELLKRNNRVCFEFDVDVELVPSEQACSWTVRGSSVIGFGKASLIEDPEEKGKALNVIMRKYSGKDWEFKDETVERVAILKVEIESMTGKQKGN